MRECKVRFSQSAYDLVAAEADKDRVSISRFVSDAAFARAIWRAAQSGDTRFERANAVLDLMDRMRAEGWHPGEPEESPE